MFRQYIRQSVGLSIVAIVIAVTGCSSGSDNNEDTTATTPLPAATPGVGNTVYDNIVNNPNLEILRQAIDRADLANVLDNEASEFTVFAPDNSAFQALENANADVQFIDALLANPEGLASILKLHVIEGAIDFEEAMDLSSVSIQTLNGTSLPLNATATSLSGLAFGGADIIRPDSDYIAGASIGVVHVIDTVLLLD